MSLENDPIRLFQSKLQEAIHDVDSLRPIVKACQEAIQRAESSATLVVGARSAYFSPKIDILLTCRTLNETIPLFRELAKEGLRTDKEDTYTDRKLMDVIPMREYNLGPDVCLVVMLLNVKTGEVGPNCRMEQVGVKEVPIYEMKCD